MTTEQLDSAAGTDIAPRNGGRGHTASRFGVSSAELVVVAIVGLSTVVWLPVFVVNTVPRNAAALMLAPLGLGLMIAAARRRAPAAWAALACVAVFAVAGLVAEAPRVAFAGQMPEWASVVALVTSLGWWSVGRSVSARARLLLLAALTAGALLNGLLGIAQLIVGAQRNELFGTPGRASGLMFNPVFYGSFMVAIAAIWIALASERRGPLRLALAGLLPFLAALSGSRVALGAVVVVVALSLGIWRRAAIVPAGCAAAGLVMSDLFARIVSSRSSAVERVAGGESINGRVDVWRLALEAFSERPLIGWGPSNAEVAVMRQVDLEFAQTYSADGPGTIWWDPHNFGVFLLLSVGVLGLVAVAVFVVLAVRGTPNWPYLLGAAGAAVTWLLQPATVHSLPVACLLLGLGVRPRDRPPSSPPESSADDEVAARCRLGAPWHRALLGVGIGLGLVVLGAAWTIDRSAHSREPDRAAAAAVVFGGDPWLHLYVSDAYAVAFGATGDASLLEESLEHAESAARLYPTSQHYQLAADAAVAVDEVERARTLLEQAIELQPWDPSARLRLFLVARELGLDAQAQRQREALCSISGHWCTLIDEVTSSAESTTGAGP